MEIKFVFNIVLVECCTVGQCPCFSLCCNNILLLFVQYGSRKSQRYIAVKIETLCSNHQMS